MQQSGFIRTLTSLNNNTSSYKYHLITIVPVCFLVLLMANSVNSWSFSSHEINLSSTFLPRRLQLSSKSFSFLILKDNNHGNLDELDNDSDEGRSNRVQEETWSWIKRVIIGMEFCPFAAKPCKDKRLHVKVVLGDDPEEIVTAVLTEMRRLQSDKIESGTTVIVTPDLYPLDFHRFYNFFQWMEEEECVENYEGIFQRIAFHPKFEFEGSGEEGSDNYTNRSPHPMIHILAEEDVSRAVDSYGGDASRVWRRNVALLEELHETLGKDNVERLLLRGEKAQNTNAEQDEMVRNFFNILQ